MAGKIFCSTESSQGEFCGWYRTCHSFVRTQRRKDTKTYFLVFLASFLAANCAKSTVAAVYFFEAARCCACASRTVGSSLAILMDQLARHVGGRSKYRRLFASDFGARLLMAAPSLEAARYRACASRRACIRSAHLLIAAPSLEAARYRACASRRACIRSAHLLIAAPSLEA